MSSTTRLSLDLALWGLLPGPQRWLLMAAVATLLYGRSPWFRRGVARVLRPWTDRPIGARMNGIGRWLAGHWMLLLLGCAGLIVASRVAAWMTWIYRPLAP